MTLLPLLLLLLLILTLAYVRVPLMVWIGSLVGLSVVFAVVPQVGLWATIIAFMVAAPIAVIGVTPFRRKYLSAPAFRWFRKVLPSLSDTEREALEAGTVWWDAQLFTGKPDWKQLLGTPKPELRDDERAFLDGPVEEVCRMLDDWEIRQQGDLPEAVWEKLKSERFFSMIIPKEHGGLGFSALGNSAVVMKLASRNLTAAVTVMVPNSLGPGELLMHFGTKEQQEHYLPRLAKGEEIPCFALTSPSAGSDAASMADTGIVCKGQWEGEEVLGFRLNWNKRYITLASVATVLGLAFRARDPDGLLGDEEDLGITCALIPADLEGVWAENRHKPIGSVFINGPTEGKDVFIPLDSVIGGRERIGQGWRMLMQSLAAGRAISLPALGCAGGKIAAIQTGAYARIRKQFKMPVAYFEGVEEVLTRLGGNAYRMDAARLLTMAAIDLGEKPGVLSAILKYQLTEANRRSINDAMDVHGGKGICMGPKNYLGAAYQAVPIAITVEGANILTRTLIIFGQGAIRCHPYIIKEMMAAQEENSDKTLAEFDRAFFGHIGFTISNTVRTLIMGLTGARFVRSPVAGKTAHYYRQLTRMSAAFAFTADVVLLALGGAFKFKEKISGRLADILSHLYLSSAVLKRFEDTGRPEEDLPMVHWAIRDSLFIVQDRFINTLRNFPVRWLGRLILRVVFPLGHPYREPADSHGKRVARVLIGHGPARDRIAEGLFVSQEDDASGLVLKAFDAVLEAWPVERALKNAFGRVVSIDNYEELVQRGLDEDVIDEEQAKAVRRAQQLSAEVIAVDDFPPEDF